ncbi:hypothetical protein M892_24475 [Vibrio campbellii ATCC BAA-1116]|nr:hypothetical protein M892_24475 [Vibrio campbellii ATCC BAA-1116]
MLYCFRSINSEAGDHILIKLEDDACCIKANMVIKRAEFRVV